MVKAIWNDVVIAESDETVVIEGNHYFPPQDIKKEYFKGTETQTICAWKGIASYYNIEVNGEVNIDAAWYYPEISELAKGIKDYVAFWKGVEVK
ncbi:hypothetical protein LCGC14_0050310 [marine sediment metagenome]|uniref:DUF427 domain-containing protein n=1 Tax=marine sediment metagenome TaxID=412755 RepID=A0A0F9W600_9ZZZZ|nr:DUF427 domain-containing protein [Maribacter sp.]HDZ06845.1 DUF427 domain-containing protein [Maribacter sp.]HEA81025.1 DUF427 domain-containing protein [Maribacter sp.]